MGRGPRRGEARLQPLDPWLVDGIGKRRKARPGGDGLGIGGQPARLVEGDGGDAATGLAIHGQEPVRGPRSLDDRECIRPRGVAGELDVQAELARPESRQMPVGLLGGGGGHHVGCRVPGLVDRVAPMLHRHRTVAVERVRPARDVAGRVDVGVGLPAMEIARQAPSQVRPPASAARPAAASQPVSRVAPRATMTRSVSRTSPPARCARRTCPARPRGADHRVRAEIDPGAAHPFGQRGPDRGSEQAASGVGLGSTSVTASRGRGSTKPPRSRSGRRQR